MSEAIVYVFDESEVQEGWPTSFVSLESYDNLRNSHRVQRAALEEAYHEVSMCHEKPCFCKYCREGSIP